MEELTRAHEFNIQINKNKEIHSNEPSPVVDNLLFFPASSSSSENESQNSMSGVEEEESSQENEGLKY